MNVLSQFYVVAELSMRGFPGRLRMSLVIIVGVGCVVAVLLSMLSFSTGLHDSILAAASSRRAIVTAANSNGERGYGVTRAVLGIVIDAPGIALDRSRRPIVSAEASTIVSGHRKSDHGRLGLVVRGIGSEGLSLRPAFHLTAGRMFTPGKHELIVGRAAQNEFVGLQIGNVVPMPAGPWTIVGTFATGGDQTESELLADTGTLLSAIHQNGFGSILVQLRFPGAFGAFSAAIKSTPSGSVAVERQTDFYERTSGQFTIFMATLAYILGAIMAFGALFGVLNVMYSAVSARERELATLRAIGFAGLPLAMAVIAEGLILALVGALLGAGAAWLLFNGRGETEATYVFALLINGEMVWLGCIWAAAIASLGGLLPAIRAASFPVARALART